MAILIVGLIVFFGIHSLSIANEPFRTRMVTRLGVFPFKGIYSVIAVAGLILIIWGYGMARVDPILVYTPPAWFRHLSMLLLIPVFPLLVAAYFPGRISAKVKHPMLVAIKLWALGHLLANGMLHDILLFGSFLAWAFVDRISFKRRQSRTIPTLPTTSANDAIAVVGGLVVYGLVVFWAHQWLTGVASM